MEYVLIGILVLLIVGAGVAFLVMSGTRRSARVQASDDTKAVGAPFAGRDHTPLGDTAEHAGEQDEEGRTVTPSDAERHGGTGRPISGPHAAGHSGARPTEESPGRYKRDPVGGEAEGAPTAPVGDVPQPPQR